MIVLPLVVAALCEYEVIAIASRGKIPTLSALNERYHVLGPLILGGLTAHFYLARCVQRGA